MKWLTVLSVLVSVIALKVHASDREKPEEEVFLLPKLPPEQNIGSPLGKKDSAEDPSIKQVKEFLKNK
jgi:hypothetical protein